MAQGLSTPDPSLHTSL